MTAVEVASMIHSLEDLDEDALHKSIDRFTTTLFDEMYTMRWYAQHVARHELTAQVVTNVSDRATLELFVQRFLNTTVAYHDDGTGERVYGCGSLVNYWGIVDLSFETLWYEYHPGDNERYCTLPSITPDTPSIPSPIFPPEYLASIIQNSTNSDKPWNGFESIFRPMGVTYPMFINIESIIIPDERNQVAGRQIHGYLVSAKTIKYHIGTYANSVPGCIATIMTDDEVDKFSEFDKEMWDFDKEIWDTTVAGTLDAEANVFTGVPNFTKRHVDDLENPLRVCPSMPLFHETDEMMTGYFRLCSKPPEKGVNNTCIFFRMDRPMSRHEEGTTPMIVLAVLIIGLIFILFVSFIIFLDLAVLRRVVNLSETIRQQTLKHHEDFKDDDFEQNATDEKTGKGEDKLSDNKTSNRGDEIGNLKLAMEQNTYRLRKRIEAINDVVRMERQKTLRHKQAMQLLCLWCDRHEFYPGLRPNAVLLRYEPTRSLDDLLSNPLAVEYLKSHCGSDCTLENLFFLLDVSWLLKLEAAEDRQEDPTKRKQIHHVASATAASIIAHYIADDAPQQINLSSAVFEALRDKNTPYKRGMFKEAVREVKLMVNTDILPRFKSTTAYTAMSENLFVDATANDEDSEPDSESVSTGGSVLTDETAPGASNMVAFNFRNLYATLDGETDVGSTYTNVSSVVGVDAEGSDEEAVDVYDDAHTTSTGWSENKRGTVCSSVKAASEKGDANEFEASDANSTEAKEKHAEKEGAKEKPAKKEGTKEKPAKKEGAKEKPAKKEGTKEKPAEKEGKDKSGKGKADCTSKSSSSHSSSD